MLVAEKHKSQSRESMILDCYKRVFPIAASYIQKRGGSLSDAREVFQGSLVMYYEKLVHTGFEVKQDEQAYLMGIVKKRWLKYRSKIQLTTDFNSMDRVEEKEPEIHRKRLLQLLKQSGQRCMDLLQSFYYEKISIKQLAERFGYTSERSATVQKYKCLEKVRGEVKLRSLQYEDFFE